MIWTYGQIQTFPLCWKDSSTRSNAFSASSERTWAHLVEMAIKDVKTASNIEKGVMILDKACLVQWDSGRKNTLHLMCQNFGEYFCLSVKEWSWVKWITLKGIFPFFDNYRNNCLMHTVVRGKVLSESDSSKTDSNKGPSWSENNKQLKSCRTVRTVAETAVLF